MHDCSSQTSGNPTSIVHSLIPIQHLSRYIYISEKYYGSEGVPQYIAIKPYILGEKKTYTPARTYGFLKTQHRSFICQTQKATMNDCYTQQLACKLLKFLLKARGLYTALLAGKLLRSGLTVTVTEARRALQRAGKHSTHTYNCFAALVIMVNSLLIHLTPLDTSKLRWQITTPTVQATGHPFPAPTINRPSLLGLWIFKSTVHMTSSPSTYMDSVGDLALVHYCHYVTPVVSSAWCPWYRGWLGF
jgi:hypothetical protein